MELNKNEKSIQEVVYRLNVQAEIETELLSNAMRELLYMEESDSRNVLLGCMFTGLMARDPSVNEISTLLESAFSRDSSPNNNDKYVIEIPEGKNLISLVGSGKKGVKTVNISTASSLVGASMGCYVAKPGSSSVSSLTGSSDFLEEVGVDTQLPIDEMSEVLRDTDFGIFKIENYLKNFGKLYNNKFHTPHVLSYGLAALANPIKVDKLLYGFTHHDIEKSLDVLMNFGFNDIMVASCTANDIHYIDEIGIYGKNRIIGAKNGKKGRLKKFQPTEELDLPRYSMSDIQQGKSVYDNVQKVVKTLQGKGEQPLEDIIAINGSGILFLDDKVESLKEGYEQARIELQSGRPYEKLEEVVDSSGGDMSKLRRY